VNYSLVKQQVHELVYFAVFLLSLMKMLLKVQDKVLLGMVQWVAHAVKGYQNFDI
jgi:hypothetical protein